MFRTVAIAVCLFSVLIWTERAGAEPKLRGFLVGVQSYAELRKLSAPEADVSRVAERLRARGFIVDATNIGAEKTKHAALRKAWKEFLGKVESGDVVVIFFAGHGIERNGHNYLLASDTPKGVVVDGSIALDVQEMVDEASQRKPALSLFILDACRNNPFGDSPAIAASVGPATAPVETAIPVSNTTAAADEADVTRAVQPPPGLAPPKRPPKNVFIMYSAGVRQTALDGGGEGGNSLFTTELGNILDADKDDKLSLADIAQQVRYSVYRQAWETKKHTQTPAYYDQLGEALSLRGVRVGRRTLEPPGPEQWLSLNGVEPKASDIIIECKGCPELVVLPSETESTKPIAIGRFEVTQAEWRMYLCQTKKLSCEPPDDAGDRLPVANVSHAEAKEYVDWLTKLSKLKNNRGRYRLPTEAEWEYAARAGSTGDYAFDLVDDKDYAEMLCDYANGADLSTKALGWVNFKCDDGFPREAAPVGSFLANAFGLFDVHGNVWEWVEKCWGPQDQSQDAAQAQDKVCDYQIARGGSWRSGPDSLRTVSRQAFPADTTRATIGFRVVRDLE